MESVREVVSAATGTRTCTESTTSASKKVCCTRGALRSCDARVEADTAAAVDIGDESVGAFG